MSSTIEEKVKNFIREAVKETTGEEIELTHDQSLIDGGVVDSLSIVRLIQALQKEFVFDITASDITLDNFDTLSLLVHFVKRKLEEKDV